MNTTDSAAPTRKATTMLNRIDELLAETAWLQAKWSQASTLFQDRINARLEMICGELRRINLVTDFV